MHEVRVNSNSDGNFLGQRAKGFYSNMGSQLRHEIIRHEFHTMVQFTSELQQLGHVIHYFVGSPYLVHYKK